MKNVLFVMLFALISIKGYSQNPWNPTRAYCDIVGTSNFTGTKNKIEVDFGQARNVTNGAYNRSLVDKDGKEIKFNSMVDALNYMAQLGWKFEQAYVLTENNKQNVYHYLLSRELKEGEEVDTGIYTRHDYKEDKKTNDAETKVQKTDKSSRKNRKRVDDIY